VVPPRVLTARTSAATNREPRLVQADRAGLLRLNVSQVSDYTVRNTTLILTAILVAVPAAAQIPTPASVLGFEPGADFHLATYEESVEYFQLLDASSDRITMMRTGKTSEGRDWWIALISSPENLASVISATCLPYERCLSAAVIW